MKNGSPLPPNGSGEDEETSLKARTLTRTAILAVGNRSILSGTPSPSMSCTTLVAGGVGVGSGVAKGKAVGVIVGGGIGVGVGVGTGVGAGNALGAFVMESGE